MKFEMTQPCAHCPFRSDIDGYLTRARVIEIAESILDGQKTFSCHKTNDFSDEDGEPVETADSQHCAGALIFLEKQDRPNQMMRIAERLGRYDRTKLKMDSPVFDSVEEFAEAQER